ncbi:MAG: glycosyltransferase family 1 protein [Gammaproteobacteria bacterium]|nr:MAG: glycosyltransferase family 1 protein [Gammaproteobacteria bacterium]
MRISLVTETYTPEINGVAKTLARLVSVLRERGHSVHIIRPRQKNEDHRTDYHLTHIDGLPIPGYSGLQFGLPAGSKLYRLWRSETPDIIYVATEGPLGWSAVKTANKLNIPVISGFHTNFHSYSRHYKLGWLEPLIFSYLKHFHNKTTCTLAPSPELVKQLKKRGIENAQLFSRGIDSVMYHPLHRNNELRRSWQVVDESIPIALYVGRIAAEKNINLVIETYKAMQEYRPQLRLVMVGDGPLLNKLRKQHPDIIFTGAKLGTELSQHFASADIFLFASETETFGNVILEAMSSGLAVVAYDYAAARMHIADRQNGMTCEPGNRQAFIAKARELASNSQLMAIIRTQARFTAEQNDWQHIIDHFENMMVTYVKSEQRDDRESKEPVSVDGSA